MKRPTHSYIGKCRGCNATVASVYDMTDDRNFTAKTVAKMIASGLDVERVPLSSVIVSDCTCSKEPERLPLFAQEPTP